MSSGRKLDRAEAAFAERAHHLSQKNRNWLRHGKETSAGLMDEMLFEGATVDEMAKKAGTTRATVYVHLNHLRKEHKLTVVKRGGKFRYAHDPGDGSKSVKNKSVKKKTG